MCRATHSRPRAGITPAAPCRNPHCGTTWGAAEPGSRRPSRRQGRCHRCYRHWRKHGADWREPDPTPPPPAKELRHPLRPSRWRIDAFCAVFRRRRPRDPAHPAIVPGSRLYPRADDGHAYFARPWLEI